MKRNISILMMAATFVPFVVTGISAAESRIRFSPVLKEAGSNSLVVRIEGAETLTFPVTDIHLDIVSWEGDAHDFFVAPNQSGRDPFQWDYYAAIFVVAGGKLFRDGGGMCSPWENDVSVCTIECDGGHFLMHRELGKKFDKVSVILKPIPELIEGDQSSEFRIGGCGGDEDEILLDVNIGSLAKVTFSRWAE